MGDGQKEKRVGEEFFLTIKIRGGIRTYLKNKTKTKCTTFKYEVAGRNNGTPLVVSYMHCFPIGP